MKQLNWFGVWVLPWVVIALDYFTIWQLWNWFVSDISFPAMLGVVFTFGLLLWMCTKETSYAVMQLRQALVLNFLTKEEQSATTTIKNFISLLVPLFSLACGYIVTLFQ